MFFDRYEIHIQAFGDLFTAKLMSGDSSSSTFDDFKILPFVIIKILSFQKKQIQITDT